jgi:hypothetical protein
MQPEYINKMHNLNDGQKSEWLLQFQDWNYMKLKEDLELNEDFILIS